MKDNTYLEVFCQQKNHENERICGDVFLTKKIKEENRIIAVLSDGMGSGVKANVLATLTATMALNFTEEHKDARKIAEIIMNTLPVCSERKISYSTFTIVDIDLDENATIIEYDNPQAIIVREKKVLSPDWEYIVLESEENKGKEIKTCKIKLQKGDRVIFGSDGTSQSGMGTKNFPFGWGRDNMQQFILENISKDQTISAEKLSEKVVSRAFLNDNYQAKDDISCATLYFREPRELLVCTGPPYEEENDTILGKKVKVFEGAKIICGATTSDIIARELKQKIEDSFEFDDPDLPPISYMDGIDLITEGILTLSKATDLLDSYTNNDILGKGPADQIIKLMLQSDVIHFVVGTRINIAHQDPNLPVELEMRRNVVKRMSHILEEKFLKEIRIEFI